MKYVILIETVSEDISRAHHMIFPEHMTHSVVAMGYMALFKIEEKKEVAIYSAGFCNIDSDGDWDCLSGSDSLGIAHNPEVDSLDEKILNRAEAFNGLVY